jgi:hypothetical protein
MASSQTNKVLELFGCSTRSDNDWSKLLNEQACPFSKNKCFKVRKSEPDVSIGTCTVRYGQGDVRDIIICPHRMLERRQVFTDCIHLLTQHDPGNELHIIPEVSIPGGSVDYFLASAHRGKIKDFVGIEFQTLDTTGTVWPERQRLIAELGLAMTDSAVDSRKPFGMNWKMTAKTILVQMHHKVDTLEHVGKHLVLVIQDCLLAYLKKEFNFAHISNVRVGDTMHIHSYVLEESGQQFKLQLNERLSTDADGVAQCLGIQAETKIELESIISELEKKLSDRTLFSMDAPIPVGEDMPSE